MVFEQQKVRISRNMRNMREIIPPRIIRAMLLGVHIPWEPVTERIKYQMPLVGY